MIAADARGATTRPGGRVAPAGAPVRSTPRRTLILLAKQPRPDLRARIAAGDEPRAEYLELAARLGAEILDFHDVAQSGHPVVQFLARRLGARWGLAALGTIRHGAFDDLYATGEDVGIPLALLLRARRVRGKLTMVVHNADTPKRRALIRAAGHRVFRYVVCLGSEQVRVLTGAIGLPARQVRCLHNWLDHAFFRPLLRDREDFVLAVGMESRDYATLQAAASALPYRFHVIASGWSPNAGYAAAEGIGNRGNVVVERGVTTDKLRELYARARFVVVPLKAVPYAAGVTAILEAMAMGKALVASASPGIRDYVIAGTSARVVPVGDAPALRAAIQALWNDEAEIARMERHNRAWVETTLNTDHYVGEIAGMLEATS